MKSIIWTNQTIGTSYISLSLIYIPPFEEELTVEDDLLILVPMFPTIALRDEEWRLPRLLQLSVASWPAISRDAVSAADDVLLFVLCPLFSEESQCDCICSIL